MVVARLKKLLGITLLGCGCFTLSFNASADAEVTLSGSTWLASVDGDTVYSGSRMFDAVNAAANNMGEGIINVRNSGESGTDGGEVYAMRPQAGQTLDFHGHTVTANGGDLVVPVYCNQRDNITVRNLNVEGSPRYGVWFRGCSYVTLENITMAMNGENPVGLGIRVDSSTADATNLTIKGNIVIDGATGHGIETYGIDGIDIGDVTVTNNGGCGLILNDSTNAEVGNVWGEYNNIDGGYATFRVANNNGPNIHVNSVYSRHSGRGFFSVSGSHGTTIEYVDIEDATQQGIFLEDASDTHVLAGVVSDSSPNCQLVRTEDSSIRVQGCDEIGTTPDTNSNGLVDGVYRIIPNHSSKTLDVANCSENNGSNVQQWSWLDNDCQKFQITPVSGIWHRITPLIASSKAFDIDSMSLDNSANAMLWDYWGGTGQLFRFQSAGEGLWRLVNLHSQKCLDVENSSVEDGANLMQYTCLSDGENQKFRLEKID